MFTGIVTDIGEITALEDHGTARRIAIAIVVWLGEPCPIFRLTANSGVG